MNTTSDISDSEEQVLDEFRQGREAWRHALEAHRMAPPDPGFADRLAALAEAASEGARTCRAADRAGFDWPPHRATGAQVPYELQRGTGRRGPERLWRRFDAAITQLNVAATGQSMPDVADAYDELATATAELAEAVRSEDNAASPPARTRARRSA